MTAQGYNGFATRLVNSVLNLPDTQVKYFSGNSNNRTVINAHQFCFRATVVKVTDGLVHASDSKRF